MDQTVDQTGDHVTDGPVGRVGEDRGVVVASGRTAGPRRGVPEPTDRALVRAARLGDEQAFRRIVDRYGRGMYRYALRLVGGSESDAAEVTQEAFISAWRSLEGFRGDSSLKTWLFRLVHRRSVDLVRKRRPTPVDEDALVGLLGSSLDNAVQHVLDEELLSALQVALNELPCEQRSAWLLREIEGMSYDEIGEALAMPVSSVRGLLHRARRTLAERMARWR